MSQHDVIYRVTNDRLWYGRDGRLTPCKSDAVLMNARDARRVRSEMGVNWCIEADRLVTPDG